MYRSKEGLTLLKTIVKTNSLYNHMIAVNIGRHIVSRFWDDTLFQSYGKREGI